MRWIEVYTIVEYDFVVANIKATLSDSLEGYDKFSSISYREFGNGDGGYYLPIPDSIVTEELEDYFIENLSPEQILTNVPSFSNPGTFIPVTQQTSATLLDQTDITNFGSLVESRTANGVNLFVDKNDKLWILVVFRGGSGAALIDPVVETYQVIDTFTGGGSSKIWKPVYHASTHSIILFSASPQPALYKLSIDPTFEIVDSVDLTPHPSNGSGIQDRAIAENGDIVIGLFRNGVVARYNPTTEVLTEYSTPFQEDINTVAAYHIAGDANFIYVVWRTSGNYYVGMLNCATDTWTYFWNNDPEEGQYRSGSINRQFTDGNYNYRVAANNSNIGASASLILVRNGVVSLVDGELYPPYDVDDINNNPFESNLYFGSDADVEWDDLGYERDISNINGVQTGICTLRYREIGEVTWQEVALSGITLGFEKVQALNTFNSGAKICAMYGNYGAVAIIDIATGVVDNSWNWSFCSKYLALPLATDDLIIMGYANRADRFKLDEAINFSDNSNPKRITPSNGNAFYLRHAVLGDDNWVYFNEHLERNTTGMVARMYNTVTEAVITQDSESALYEEWYSYWAGGIIYLAIEELIIILARPRGASPSPRLYIFDTSTEKNIFLTEPVRVDVPIFGSNGSLGAVFRVGSNLLGGVESNVIYTIDLADNYAIVARQLPINVSSQWSVNKQVCQLSDGRVIIQFTNASDSDIIDVWEVDFTTYTITKIASINQSSAPNVTRRYIQAAGTKLVMYGGVNSITDDSQGYLSSSIEVLDLT